MKRLFYFILPIVIIISFIFFMQYSIYNIVNAQTMKNEIIQNTLEIVKEDTTGIPKTTESLKNTSEVIAMSTENTTISNNNFPQQIFQIEDIANNLNTFTKATKN